MNLPTEFEHQIGYVNVAMLFVGFLLVILLGIVVHSLHKLLMGVNTKIVDLYAHYFNDNHFLV